MKSCRINIVGKLTVKHFFKTVLIMPNEKEFDLTGFMPESLLVSANAMAPTRKIYDGQKDFYKDFINQDPYKVLGLVDFTAQPEVPEHVKGSEIQEFFRDSNVFVTGGTGFLGKVLIEKLIRSVPHIGQVYILIRPKRGKSAKERFNQLMNDKVSEYIL